MTLDQEDFEARIAELEEAHSREMRKLREMHQRDIEALRERYVHEREEAVAAKEQEFRNSRTWKIGSVIWWVPRRIKDAFRAI